MKKCLDQTILSFIFTIVCCTPTSNDFSQEEEKLSDKKLFCLKKYKSVKQQFSFWFFLIFSRAPFFRISNKVDSDSPGYLLSCHGCFFYRRNNFIKFQLRPLWKFFRPTCLFQPACLFNLKKFSIQHAYSRQHSYSRL